MSPDATATPQQIGMYDLISKIAEGGMGAVYKAKSRVTGQIVAIKIIPPDTAKNPILVRRFEQEFKAASLLDHPNVVKAIEYCGTGPSPFLVMEFVDGESLGQRVERDGRVAESLAVHFIAQVCDGLHRAHKQGLIHRDVKPDNILVTADGTAKLTDMGLVKDVEGEQNLTRTGRGLGTPHFMAPEQFRNAKNADVRCDIYSLGATLYMLVTGEVPFAKTSPLDCWMRKIKNDYPPPRQVNPRLSERIDWAIRRAMSAEPKERPASCREFVEDLTGQTARRGGGADSAPGLPPVPKADLWYLVYKGPNGEPLTVKGTTDSIRQNVKAGNLGDPAGVLVSRTKTGKFAPLRSTAEFRDLVVSPAAVTPAQAAQPTNRVPRPTPGPPAPPGARPAAAPPPSRPAVPDDPPAPRRPLSDPAAEVPTDPTPVAALSTPADEMPAWARDEAEAPPSWKEAGRSPAWVPWVVIGLAVASAAAGAFFLANQ
jgi:serine/threonine protein kinase